MSIRTNEIEQLCDCKNIDNHREHVCQQFTRRMCSASQDVPVRPPERSINKVILVGRAGTDAQVRGSDDMPYTILSIATNNSWKRADGSLAVRTDWHRIAVFRPGLQDKVAAFIKSGDRVYVEGTLNYNTISDGEQTTKLTSVVADTIINFTKKGQLGLDEEM